MRCRTLSMQKAMPDATSRSMAPPTANLGSVPAICEANHTVVENRPANDGFPQGSPQQR